jgi:hypothetical protein
MRWYHYLLLALKIIFLVEFTIILYDKDLVSQRLYVGTEILFKLLLSIYIQYVVVFVVYKNMSIEDQMFISFGSGLLMYDAIFNDIPHLLEMYGVKNASLVR